MTIRSGNVNFAARYLKRFSISKTSRLFQKKKENHLLSKKKKKIAKIFPTYVSGLLQGTDGPRTYKDDPQEADRVVIIFISTGKSNGYDLGRGGWERKDYHDTGRVRRHIIFYNGIRQKRIQNATAIRKKKKKNGVGKS